MEKVSFAKELKGDRIVLKQYPCTLEHAEEVFETLNFIQKQDKDTFDIYFPWAKSLSSVKDYFDKILIRAQDKFDSGEEARYAIFVNDKFVGQIWAVKISFENEHCRIGYWLDARQTGNGYITEAFSVLEESLFGMGFTRIETGHAGKNEKSKRVIERMKYFYEGTQRNFYNNTIQKDDLLFYSKLKSEYEKEGK